MQFSSKKLIAVGLAMALSITAIADEAGLAAAVFTMTGKIWSQVFQENNAVYRQPRMVFYEELVSTACGTGSKMFGPFYCPNDETIYLDLSFFEELAKKFDAPGDAAQAYVVAHEVGHHVQKLTGILAKVQELKLMNPGSANQLQVRLELHADCLAGVWTRMQNNKKKILEPGDIGEIMNAAAQIGDDRIQMRQSGAVQPESFTHGTAEQRQRWFRRGIISGRYQTCSDVFKSLD